MIKHHPSDTLLIKFAEGSASPVESLMVSAHCDMCHTCRSKVDSFTTELASKHIDQASEHAYLQRDYALIFDTIVESDAIVKNESAQINKCGSANRSLFLDGREFAIPKTLGNAVSQSNEWRHLLGKIWFNAVDLGGGYLAQFIYMEKGGCVPEHSHKGHELTLVLDGEFSDGHHAFDTGDFVLMDHNDTHAPIATSDNGCLVFCILDKPLYFNSGWARLINPLSHLYFNAKS